MVKIWATVLAPSEILTLIVYWPAVSWLALALNVITPSLSTLNKAPSS